MNVSHCSGELHPLFPEHKPNISFFWFSRWVLYVNGKERITDCPAVNTGLWYHIGVSWRSWDGDWRIYINGKPSDGGKGLSVGTTIPGVVLSSTCSAMFFFFCRSFSYSCIPT